MIPNVIQHSCFQLTASFNTFNLAKPLPNLRCYPQLVHLLPCTFHIFAYARAQRSSLYYVARATEDLMDTKSRQYGFSSWTRLDLCFGQFRGSTRCGLPGSNELRQPPLLYPAPQVHDFTTTTPLR